MIPNFNFLSRPMSQFGPRQTMAQGYSGTVSNAVPAYQQMLQMQQANPGISNQLAISPLVNRPVQGGQQFAALQQAARPVNQFAGYAARQGANPQAVLADIAKNGVANQGGMLNKYGSWMDAEVQRANASGMLSGGLGAMIPGLLMSAIPAAGLAKAAMGAGFGGIRGGPLGAVKGALPSPTNFLRKLV